MALLFMALTATSPLESMWIDWKDSRNRRARRSAIMGRARAVVQFDRIINGEQRPSPPSQVK